MRYWLTLVLSLILFTGCTTATNTPQPYKPTTYNLSSSAKKSTNINQKSTATYPGSEPGPVIDTTITSTTVLAMATPTPPTPGMEEPVSEDGLKMAAPMPQPLNDDSTMIKIAVLIPQKTIKKYAITTVNSVMSYLLYKNYYFDLNVFNSGDEQEAAISKALSDIKAGGYQFIIAPVTATGASIIASQVQDTIVFIPTLHRSALPMMGSNIVFGGIDYDQQIALLAQKANERVGTFEDGSGLSYQLNSMIKQNSNRVFYEKRVESSKTNFRGMFRGNTSLNNASLYLNTPLVTSSLIASQLRSNSINPYVLLSTQINYNPLFLTLTQYEDRDRMYIANSIQKAPTGLEEINAMFGHEIIYDWVNYSTSIGADYLCQQFFDGKVPRIFNEALVNNQVIYNTALYKPGRNEFIKAD